MATWTSPKFECRSWHSAYENDDYDYYSWTYQTTADVLTITKRDAEQRCAYGNAIFYPEKTEDMFLGPNEGHALYKCLRNWVRRYGGEKVLAALDAEELNA